MVFGTTYCGISHLPIEDGDSCMLVPLGFRMNHKFDRYNKADINAFAYLYTFIDEIIEVKYNGNISDIEYANDYNRHKKGEEFEAYELFMLVHKGFYEKIINEGPDRFKTVRDLNLFNTVYPIWEKATDLERSDRHGKSIKFVRKEITEDEYAACLETPEWIRNIYKVARFMGHMGIPPHPIFCSDQHESGKIYEQYRKEFI